MASIIVKDLNYITTGKNEKFVSLDIGYSTADFDLAFLTSEDDTTALNGGMLSSLLAQNTDILTFVGEGNSVIRLSRTMHDDYYTEFFLKYAQILDVVYVASIEKDLDSYTDTKDNKNNIYSVFQKNSNNIVHNLYDLKDVAIRTNNRVDECSYLYGPDINDSLIGIVQNDNYTYGLTNITNRTVNYGRSILYANNTKPNPLNIKDCTHYMSIDSDSLYTYIYNPISMSSEDMQKNYIPATNLKSLSCNYILELQNNDEFNDFEEGDIYGDTFTGKYAYNSTYSMDLVKDSEYIEAANELSITEYLSMLDYLKQALINNRRYFGIDKCGDTIFLKYYDDVWYNKTSSDVSSVYHDSINRKETSPLFNATKYQKIETILSINRFEPNATHRSNMYSIRIHDTGLNKTSKIQGLQKLKNTMMQDILNNIKLIVDKICPANTQLLKVEFK